MVFVSGVSAVPRDKEFINLSVYSKRSLYLPEFFRVLPSNKLKKNKIKLKTVLTDPVILIVHILCDRFYLAVHPKGRTFHLGHLELKSLQTQRCCMHQSLSFFLSFFFNFATNFCCSHKMTKQYSQRAIKVRFYNLRCGI